jgi:F0F1-type ATP synthase assembly protein I
MGMIRSLFDVENMPEDDEKTGNEGKPEELESAEIKTAAEETADENIVEETIKPTVREKQEIKHLPADEIISKLNKREEITEEILINKEEDSIHQTPIKETVSEVELPFDPPNIGSETYEDDSFFELEEAAKQIESKAQLEDDSFFELEEAAKKIEREIQIESETKPEISIPINEEFEFEDPKVMRLESELAEIENELLAEKEAEEKLKAEKTSETRRKSSVVNSIFDDVEEPSFSETKASGTTSFLGETETTDYIKSDDNSFIIDAKPESKVETFRKSGMAYSAAIVLLGAVVFMMIIGWGADLLLGTSPWGIVVGIVLGSIIGFIQFFRVTSEIFKQ